MRQQGGERAGMQRLQYYIWGGNVDTVSPAAAVESRVAAADTDNVTGPSAVEHSSSPQCMGCGAETGWGVAGGFRAQSEGLSGRMGGVVTEAAGFNTELEGLSGGDGAEAGGLSAESGGSRAETVERARQALLQTFKETRMLAGGADSSTHLSAFLAAGCLSPRMVYAAVSAAAEQLGPEQCQWLLMHLIIRCALDESSS